VLIEIRGSPIGMFVTVVGMGRRPSERGWPCIVAGELLVADSLGTRRFRYAP
jgi:hypothetical protein